MALPLVSRSRRLAVLAVAATALAASAARAANPGDLDPTFNGGSPVLLDLAQSAPRRTGLAAAADDGTGAVVAAGNTSDPNGMEAMVITRLTASGAPDAAFGSGGATVLQAGQGTGMSEPFSLAGSVAGRPGNAGWLVMGFGSASDARNALFAAAFLPNGLPDINYGNGGSVRVQPAGPAPQYTNGLKGAVAPDGTVYIAGVIEVNPTTGANRKLAVASITSLGQVATFFGNNGGSFVGTFSQYPGDTGSYGHAPLVIPGGVLVAGVTLAATSRQQVLLLRLTVGGQLDTTFAGGAGYRAVQVARAPGLDSAGNAIARGPDNSIYVAGAAADSDSRLAFSVTRFTPAGNLDTTFGAGGSKLVQTAVGSTRDFNSNAEAVAVQGDGRVLLIGSSGSQGSGGAEELVVLRLDTSGNLDPTFGMGGIVRLQASTDMTPATFGSGGTIAADGRSLVVVGATSVGTTAKGLVTRVLLEPFTPTTTTTTTTIPAGGCTDPLPLTRALCHLAALRADVASAVPAGRIRERLASLIASADDKARGAGGLAARKRRARLRKVGVLLGRFQHRLGSRPARHAIPADVAGGLHASADAILRDLHDALAGG